METELSKGFLPTQDIYIVPAEYITFIFTNYEPSSFRAEIFEL